MLLIDLLLAGLCAAVAAALGGRLLTLLGLPDEGDGSRFFYALGAGLMAASYGVLGLGLLGWLKPALFWAALALGTAVFFREIVSGARRGLGYARAFLAEERGRFDTALLALIGLTLVSGVLFNHAPPTGEDELIYHLSLPLQYLRHGRIFHDPLDPFGSFFLTLNMAYIPLLAMRGAMAAKLLSPLFAAADCALLYFTLRGYAGRRPALLAAALFLTAPLTIGLIGIGKIDLELTFYALLALLAYLRYREAAGPSEPRWLKLFILSAAGLGAGKNTGPFFVVALGLMLAWGLLAKRKRPYEWLAAAAGYTAAVGLFVLPWLLKNWLWTGNPLYPARLPGGLPYDETFAMLLAVKHPFAPLWVVEKYFLDLITGTGYVIAAFLPVYLVSGNKNVHVNRLLLFPLAFLPVLALSGYALDLSRYSHACYAVFAAAAAWAVVRVSGEYPRLGRPVLWLTLALVLFPNVLMAVYFGAKRLPYAAGLRPWESYLAAEYDFEGWPTVKWIGENVPAGDAVMSLGPVFPKTYYYRQRLLAGNRPSLLRLPFARALPVLKAEGVKYLIFDRSFYFPAEKGVYRHRYYDWQTLYWFEGGDIKDYFEPVFTSGDVTVYRLKG